MKNMKELKIVRIVASEALAHIARCEVYQAISDYVIWSRIFLKDPSDQEAYEMMKDCEDFLMTDPRVERCIKDPGSFLYKLDRMVKRDIRRWMKQCGK